MVWLWLYLTIPSLGEVHKYVGWPGEGVYAAVVALVLWWLSRLRLAERIGEKAAWWLAIATFAAMAVLFIAIYPSAQSLRFGPGSDSDDSVNVAVQEMIHARYPYYARTYLDNEVHEMPGMLLLAVPFVIAGNSAYMNLFWLPVFVFVLTKEIGVRRALVMLWLILALCPVVMQQLVTGGNHLANSVFAAVFLWMLVRAESPWERAGAAVLLGLGLSSRANFLLLLPTAGGYMARTFGWQRTARDLGIAVGTFLLVTLPFYLYDPAQFTPLMAADRLTRLNEVVPFLGVAIGAAGVLLALWLGWKSDLLFASCALVQAFFAVVGMILSLDVSYAGYALFALFFVMLCRWKFLFEDVGVLKGPGEDSAR